MLKITNLKKQYGDKIVVKGISFDVNHQEILCILGPNGAGKSTTINMLTGILQSDSGLIQYEGQEISKILKTYKSVLGVVPQDIALYEDLSALQNITFFARLYGLKGKVLTQACLEALTLVGLFDRIAP